MLALKHAHPMGLVSGLGEQEQVPWGSTHWDLKNTEVTALLKERAEKGDGWQMARWPMEWCRWLS